MSQELGVYLSWLNRLNISRESTRPCSSHLELLNRSSTEPEDPSNLKHTDNDHEMKISKSCTQCRIGKRKCTVEKAGRSCQQCTKNGKQCSFTNTQNLPGRSIQPKGQVNSVPASSTNDITQDVTVNTRDHLVELYLRHIHDKPHTLFHPGLLRQQVRNGTFPKAVLYGIMALAAR